MTAIRNVLVTLAAMAAIVGCAKPAAPVADTTADADAVRAVNNAWFAAYKAGDADTLASLYAEDALLMAPGAASASGRAAIREAYAKDTASMALAGLSNNDGGSSDVGVSGDLAWQNGTFTITDKSGATVDTGKYLTLFQRREGKWLIIRDTWNSDAPPTPAAPAAAAPAEAPQS
jgi:uncharacterized protein (TIGR02246 family)